MAGAVGTINTSPTDFAPGETTSDPHCGGDGRECDSRDFAERCEGDRHHFRFIVSPDDALEMTDLRAFTTDLMSEMERGLGTKLVWNTEHPHLHILVRGKAHDGPDRVILR
jgi:type IV secretory pathway VirD2 relaxase